MVEISLRVLIAWMDLTDISSCLKAMTELLDSWPLLTFSEGQLQPAKLPIQQQLPRCQQPLTGQRPTELLRLLHVLQELLRLRLPALQRPLVGHLRFAVGELCIARCAHGMEPALTVQMALHVHCTYLREPACCERARRIQGSTPVNWLKMRTPQVTARKQQTNQMRELDTPRATQLYRKRRILVT